MMWASRCRHLTYTFGSNILTNPSTMEERRNT